MTPAGPEAEVLPLPFCWHAFSVRCGAALCNMVGHVVMRCSVVWCGAVPFPLFATLRFGFGILLLALSLLLLIIFLWLSACKTLPCFQQPHPTTHPFCPAADSLYLSPFAAAPFWYCAQLFVWLLGKFFVLPVPLTGGLYSNSSLCMFVCVFTLCNHFICQT